MRTHVILRRSGFGTLASLGILGVTAALAGCDEPYPDDPAIDPDAPVVQLTAPERGAYLGDVSSVAVRGRIEDDSPLRAVTINGVAAQLGVDGAFALDLPISPTGTSLLTVEAVDVDGNVGRETRAISAGPRVPLSTRMDDAVTAALSDRALAAIGRATGALVAQADLGAWVAPYNPVVSEGAPDGPDCLFGSAAVGAMDIASAQIELTPVLGGLELTAELGGVVVPMHLEYAAFCLRGQRDATMSASKVHLTGRFALGIKEGTFDLKLENPQVSFEGFQLDLGGVPGRVVGLLNLEAALGRLLASAVERLAAPKLGAALAGLDGAATTEVLGETLDLAVTPLELTASPVDARARLETSFRFRGDEAGPGFVYVPGARPSMDASAGLELAVSAGAINQLLASFWSAGGLERAFELTTGDYGGLGKLYDRVEVQALLPPSVRADDGRVEVMIPELLISFRDGARLATQIALNGALELRVERGVDGALRLSTGAPRVHVDILREGVDGANPLDRAQFEALSSFALARASNAAAGLLGAIPLPAAAHVRAVEVSGRGGYIVVDGALDE
ncbi:MAG: hypothetical protein R3B48_08535 [Kofleriaceae bacterium]